MSTTLRGCVIVGAILSLVPPPAVAEPSIPTGAPSLAEDGEQAGSARSKPSQPGADPLQPGARVRVITPELGPEPVFGHLVRVDAERIVLEVAASAATIELRRSAIRDLRVSLGMRSSANAAGTVGLVLGALVGSLMGLGVAAMSNLDCENDCRAPESAALLAVGGATVFGLAGGAIGMLAGSAVRTERWQPVQAHRIGLTITPRGRAGVAASLSIRF